MNTILMTVKLLEKPREKTVKSGNLISEAFAQFCQIRKNTKEKFLVLTFLGNFSKTACQYYRINDSLIIEGSIALNSSLNSELTKRYIEITVFKVHPFFLSLKNE